MRILGVDPGTLRTGVGLIEAQGNQYRLVHCEVIASKASKRIEERLLHIHQKLLEIIAQYQPSVAVLETVFFGRDLRAMVKIGEARACAMLAASHSKLPLFEYAPARVKQAVSGNGRATKDQIQHMIQRLLNLKTLPPSDSADALAVAICYLHTSRGLKSPPKRASSGRWSAEDVEALLQKRHLKQGDRGRELGVSVRPTPASQLLTP